MKKLQACLAATCLVTLPVAVAEEGSKAERQPGAPPAGRLMGALGIPGGMVEQLSLTEDQKQKAMEIGQKYMPQMHELRKKMTEEFRAILTDQQKKTLEEAQEQMRQRFQQGRPGGGTRGGQRGGTNP